MSSQPAAPVIDRAGAQALLEPLTELVARASVAILEIARHKITAQDKLDGSPVTQADLAADAIIVDGLQALRPDVPVVSEERVNRQTGPYLASFFIVDPLDGTREFIAGYDDYTVNIALVSDGRPLLGVIGAPALGLLWRGVVGFGAERMTMQPEPAAACKPDTDSRETLCPTINGSPRSAARISITAPTHSSRQPRRCAAIADRLGAEILPRRRRRGRHLSAPVGDFRMGYRRGPRHP